MSSTRTSNFRRSSHDHFEPETDTDPATQRRIRGQLEQIDFTAFASNGAVLAQAVGVLDAASFQRLAIAAAHARARWIGQAISIADTSQTVSAEQAQSLQQLREAFDELTLAYEGARRMIERGYLTFAPQSAT
jgi:hypothetical protein